MPGLNVSNEVLHASSVDELAALITATSGPFIRVADAWHLLCYPSLDAARKSAARKRAPIEFLTLPGRRGQYLRSIDLAAWLFTPQAAAGEQSAKNQVRKAQNSKKEGVQIDLSPE